MDNNNYGNNNGNYNQNPNNNNDRKPGGNNNNRNNNSNRSVVIVCVVIALCAVMLFSYVNSQIENAQHKEISYDEFLRMLNNNEVKEVSLGDGVIKITPIRQNPNQALTVSYYTGYISGDLGLVSELVQSGVSFKKEINATNGVVDFFVYYILPFLIILVIMWFTFKMISRTGGGMMGVGKSNAKVYVQRETGVTFQDVAGQEEAKDSLREMVDFLHNPAKYTKIGAKLPKGALLVGPPGTGKTLLAKAVAGEAQCPFFSLSGSDFVEMFVGVGASRVRDLFKQAQQQAPCIIFIDEVDAIGKSRESHYGGGNDEREQTLNQLLSEMDGFDTSKGLVVLAATNRPEVLDKALLRPGRFDRRVIVDKPDLKGRVDVLKVHAKDVIMDETVDLETIALATAGAVGSDLANMINEAAIMAVKEGRIAVSQKDLFEAVEVVIAGKEKKDRILGKDEKKIVAYHEIGHALVAAIQKNSEPVQKITIVPRTMGSLGYVMQVPEEEKYLMTQQDLITEITTLCGGRAAEKIMFESVTTGASNDIEKATKLARAMITQYGMSDRFGMVTLESVESKYLDGRPVLYCGEETSGKIDEEVMKIIGECYRSAVEMLEGNKELLDKLASYLIYHETITGQEFMKIFRGEKGEEEPSDYNKEEAPSDENKEEKEASQSVEEQQV